MTKENQKQQNGTKETDIDEFWLYVWNKMEKLIEQDEQA